ncbi:hypothetical protein DCAR_0208928 [Daucus carota subsp. sativus]|uniref:Uncharacterized protein n=1 Tax=Daucus carota subsp. sativus TaxID=79200 RepID=A0A161XIT4_DAUCS|nr:hypothetical protein DCAR_0208928 [Daucus carota subsp. sativus]
MTPAFLLIAKLPPLPSALARAPLCPKRTYATSPSFFDKLDLKYRPQLLHNSFQPPESMVPDPHNLELLLKFSRSMLKETAEDEAAVNFLLDEDEGDSTNSWHLFTSGDMVQGREKAEARSLKQEAEKPLKQILACEDRLVSMDASLKECMQQLRFAREEQEKRIYDAIRKSREYEEHPLSCYIL